MKFLIRTKILLSILLLICLQGCAPGEVWPGTTSFDYTFKFDLRYDSQHAYLMDYWFGESREKSWVAATPEEVKRSGMVFENVYQTFPRGGILYVKWFDEDTGHVNENLIDLNKRLPLQMNDKHLYLMLRHDQVYIYVISKKIHESYAQNVGPNIYRYHEIQQIYPDQ